jgi:4-amino-4-deoxy-L-arabinose transferase-like glycosyltransferase
LAFGIAALYLFELGGVGVLQADEPRYLAIGHAMARSGDWVTPRLWGSPWFEKPPLLYWMTAIGAASGLGPEVAGRLPVAALSLAFLWTAYSLLAREFGRQAAGVAVALLATSAGWFTYSELALTDLPLAVFFSLAVLLTLPLLRARPDTNHLSLRLFLIGACLGLAMLAKGLVPVALALPFFWFLRRFWRKWWLTFAAAAVLALPWYSAVYLRNGYPFIQDFFLKHHFERLYSASLQHVQPWYYYFPVLLGGLFPWTPLVAFFFKRATVWDERRRFLATIVVFGFLFFSVSLNKLPGYLLPLLPALFALLGAELETRSLVQVSRWWLVPSACLIALIPVLALLLPASLANGRVSMASLHVGRTEWFYIFLPLIAVVLTRRSWLGAILILCFVMAGIYLKLESFPVMNERVSARGLWQREIQSKSDSLCDAGTNREWLYGIEFYRGAALPPCANGGSFQFEIRSTDRARPVVVPVPK